MNVFASHILVDGECMFCVLCALTPPRFFSAQANHVRHDQIAVIFLPAIKLVCARGALSLANCSFPESLDREYPENETSSFLSAQFSLPNGGRVVIKYFSKNMMIYGH